MQGKRYKTEKYKQYENALHSLIPIITIPDLLMKFISDPALVTPFPTRTIRKNQLKIS